MDGCAWHLELLYHASLDARDSNNTSPYLAATLTTNAISSTHVAERAAGEVMPHPLLGKKQNKKKQTNHAVRMS